MFAKEYFRWGKINNIQIEEKLKSKGRLIVFEGPHASGKTTQAKILNSYFKKNEIASFYTKEPYCCDFKELISKYSKGEYIHSPILMYIIAADRYVHIKNIISWMQNGMFVVCDRYVLSSWVYQQIQEIPLEIIKKTNSFAINPDLTLYLDVSLNERLKRLQRTHTEPRTFFLRNDKLAEEQKLYNQLINDWDEKKYGKIVVIDGQQSIKKIKKIIVNLIFEEFK